MITIGTDCSGIEAPIEALKQLGVPFIHKWSCEIDKFARKSILVNYEPEILYEDITEREHSMLPDVYIYICGFPCQSFSLMGKKQGTGDARGNIMLHCIDVIKIKKPKVFILENVKNFKFIENGKPFNYLINELLGIVDQNNVSIYNVYYDIYNTKDYGIPQNRERIYIIGILKSEQVKEFVKPKTLEMRPLDDFIIDKRIGEFRSVNKTLLDNINKINKISSENNIVLPNKFYYPIKNISPTLNTQCASFYHTRYCKTLSINDCLLLQGFDLDFIVSVSKTQICKQIGNSMSVNVLKEIFKEIFKTLSIIN